MDNSIRNNSTFSLNLANKDIKNTMKLMIRNSSSDNRQASISLNKSTSTNRLNSLEVIIQKRNNSHENLNKKTVKPEKKAEIAKEDAEYLNNLRAQLKTEIENFITNKKDAQEFIKYSQLKMEELRKKTEEKQIGIKKIKNLKEINCNKLKQDVSEMQKKKAILLERKKQLKDEISLLAGRKTINEQHYQKAKANNEELNKQLSEKVNEKNALFDKIKISDSIKSESLKSMQLIEQKETQFCEILKKKHNKYQELKGNIRVFCRVKPILPKEQKDDTTKLEDYITFQNRCSLIINGPKQKSNTGKSAGITPTDVFSFDRVFKPSDKQEDIFTEISELVQSAIDGYKVCIFAYGQTGSGKTYTMEGEGLKNSGLIPRSLEKIFKDKSKLEDLGWFFELEASCFEIYMDQVRDLLTRNSNNIISNSNKNEKTFIRIRKIEDFYEVLTIAANKRAVAETQCNEKSSRSHFVFQVKITGRNQNTNEERFGALNLIDLAGSERIAKSKVEDERLKETISINKSLSALKGVIQGLMQTKNNKNLHIPYRDSALTFYLQENLGGDSKTLMFVNISPLISNYSETISSLKFAVDVNNCNENVDD